MDESSSPVKTVRKSKESLYIESRRNLIDITTDEESKEVMIFIQQKVEVLMSDELKSVVDGNDVLFSDDGEKSLTKLLIERYEEKLCKQSLYDRLYLNMEKAHENIRNKTKKEIETKYKDNTDEKKSRKTKLSMLFQRKWRNERKALRRAVRQIWKKTYNNTEYPEWVVDEKKINKDVVPTTTTAGEGHPVGPIITDIVEASIIPAVVIHPPVNKRKRNEDDIAVSEEELSTKKSKYAEKEPIYVSTFIDYKAQYDKMKEFHDRFAIWIQREHKHRGGKNSCNVWIQKDGKDTEKDIVKCVDLYAMIDEGRILRVDDTEIEVYEEKIIF